MKFWIAAILALCAPAFGAGVGQEGNMIVLRCASCQVGFDNKTGSIGFINGPGGQSILASAGKANLWKLRFIDGSALQSSDFTDPSVGVMRARQFPNGTLRLVYESKIANVTVDAIPGRSCIDLVLGIEKPSKDVLTADFPGSISFAPSSVKRVIFPSDLGISLKSKFFDRQAEPTGWETALDGGAGLQRVAGVACSVRAVDDPPVPCTVTEAGKQLIGDSLTHEWESEGRIVNRAFVEKPTIDFISSEHGSFLSGQRVGNGLLLRFGGKVRKHEERIAILSAERLILGLRQKPEVAPFFKPGPTRNNIIVIDLHQGPRTAGWCEIAVADWRKKLASSRELHQAGLKVTTVTSFKQMMEALSDAKTYAIINPYGEGFPIGDKKWEEVADAIKGYIESGGLWLEVGGYPFFFGMTPTSFNSMSVTYPGTFSDFAQVSGIHGELSIFGVQNDQSPAEIFVPGAWKAYGDETGGHLQRSWRMFVGKGKSWRAPAVRFLIGKDPVSAMHGYAKANGFTRTLTDKMPAKELDTWKRSVIMKYAGGTFVDQASNLDKLPSPCIVHLFDYLHGGFDKQYPDHLPPNPEKGTPEEFRALIDKAHALGDLVMPYTNPTWWCDDPKGPTFIKDGDGALLRTLDGKFQREQYGDNWGWNICPWHPDVIAAADKIVEQFTREYPADILFEDQVGARDWVTYDTNSYSPNAYAYLQGIINLSMRAGKVRPLATEHGYDRLINVQSEFCGLTWRLVPFDRTPLWLDWWLRPYSDQMDDDEWEFFPMAQFVSNGNALFAHHLGGPLVNNREILSWSVALGYQMSYEAWPLALSGQRTRDWLRYIDRVQKVIASRYMGSPLVSFRYLKGTGQHGVVESVFKNIRVVSNLTGEPYAIDKVVIAPMGFYAVSKDAEAGILCEYRGKKYYDNNLFIVRDMDRVDVYTASIMDVSLRLKPKSVLHFVPVSVSKLKMPDEWTRVAPLRRELPPKYIGVLDMRPRQDWFYSWTTIKSDEWIDALGSIAPVKSGNLSVRAIESVDDLCKALAHPDEWLAIVNPYGETIPSSDQHDAINILSRVKSFVQRGGLWFEVAGYTFFQTAIERNGQWTRRQIGPGGMFAMGLTGCAVVPLQDAISNLDVTAEGRKWLGKTWADSVSGRDVVVDRPAVEVDYEMALASSIEGVPYILGYQLGGYGWLIRFAGGGADSKVLFPTVRRVIETYGAQAPIRVSPRSAPWELLSVDLVKK